MDCGKPINSSSKRCRSCSALALKNPDVYAKRAKSISDRWHSADNPYVHLSASDRLKKAWANPDSKLNGVEYRHKLSSINKRRWMPDGALRKNTHKISAAATHNWQHGKYAHLRWNRVSKLEQRLAAALTEAGLPYIQQFLPIGFNRPADFLILGAGLIVEVDGDYWHSRPGAQENDDAKDSWFLSHGYAVVRLPECELNRLGADVVVRDVIAPEYVPHG